jgi:DNA-binding NarL/FixJ family response regulator
MGMMDSPHTAEQPALLIVEDHALVRRAVRDWLSGEFPDWRIVEAATGEEGVAAAEGQSVRVVLMDVGLPGMNGIEATRRIKGAVSNTRVLVWTLDSDGGKRRAAVEAGADAFLTKDTCPEEVVRVLRELMEEVP